ncbi:DUF2303 family protein [Dyella sp. M7H15-1]|uniref:DUF2303 family protein n=1 Tax=Dyella sp. M7H15-1 TaxID=2501295 RepID=UPI001004DFA1|nr:DUF2303 family protein [Dyella sp. M7H15-1]QAU22857.1 DUF2303 family protein [Dyella sp. M7H15-1]
MDIQLIQQTAVDAARANRLAGEDRAVILPQGCEVKSLEHLMVGRSRYRGKLVTSTLADFVSYVKAHAPADAFVDIDHMAATAFFNLGTSDMSGHGDYTATLKLPPTAAFSALNRIDGQKLTQKDLAEWLEDWHEFLTAEYAEGDATLARAITAVRKVTVKSITENSTTVTNVSSARSTMEEIEAKSDNGLPAGFNFVCEPYLGLTPRTFRLVFSVITKDDKPVFAMRWQQREATIEKIAKEFKSVLAEQLGDAAVLTIGTFQP